MQVHPHPEPPDPEPTAPRVTVELVGGGNPCTALAREREKLTAPLAELAEKVTRFGAQLARELEKITPADRAAFRKRARWESQTVANQEPPAPVAWRCVALRCAAALADDIARLAHDHDHDRDRARHARPRFALIEDAIVAHAPPALSVPRNTRTGARAA